MPRSSEDELLQYVRRELAPRRRIGLETPLFERGRIDSMNVLRLIAYVERALGRRLRSRELVMANFRTVRAISVRFLGRRG
jgi:acyl carrier protein